MTVTLGVCIRVCVLIVYICRCFTILLLQRSTGAGGLSWATQVTCYLDDVRRGSLQPLGRASLGVPFDLRGSVFWLGKRAVGLSCPAYGQYIWARPSLACRMLVSYSSCSSVFLFFLFVLLSYSKDYLDVILSFFLLACVASLALLFWC